MACQKRSCFLSRCLILFFFFFSFSFSFLLISESPSLLKFLCILHPQRDSTSRLSAWGCIAVHTRLCQSRVSFGCFLSCLFLCFLVSFFLFFMFIFLFFLWWCVVLSSKTTTPVRFELTRGNPSRFLVYRLNHSAMVSCLFERESTRPKGIWNLEFVFEEIFTGMRPCVGDWSRGMILA